MAARLAAGRWDFTSASTSSPSPYRDDVGGFVPVALTWATWSASSNPAGTDMNVTVWPVAVMTERLPVVPT